VPAAHDEPFLRLSRVREMLSSTLGLIYGCTAERKLLESVHPIAHLPQTVLGWGIDVEQGDSLEAQTEAGIDPSRPYIICIGRIEHAKGTVSLAQFWKHYCSETGTNYQLVLLGENNAQIPSDHDICVVENANDHTKWGLLRGADLLINPSAMESFSLVIFEAWAANKPVLVNKHCGATNGHIVDSSGGLTYGSYLEFESALSRLLDDSDLRNTLGRAGKAFGSSRYNWDSITNRLESFINRILVQKRPS
jgi:glycosyltransferase involved in cell wall biosynthesis